MARLQTLMKGGPSSMRLLIGLCFLVIGIVTISVAATPPQNATPLTNDDVISLKKAGLSDDLILLKINSSPTKFRTDPADLVALKNAGVSDAVVAAILKAPVSPTAAPNAPVRTTVPADLSMAAVIKPFESSITDTDAAGLPDATRAAVIQILKNKRTFSAVLSPEDAAGNKPLVEISAELVDFAAGNAATRIMIGLGTGRAHAGFAFTVTESVTGKVLLKKTIKETASFWSNSASSSAQRLELPEKVAKTFAEELQKAKIPAPQR
jgi:hypothetical protein